MTLEEATAAAVAAAAAVAHDQGLRSARDFAREEGPPSGAVWLMS